MKAAIVDLGSNTFHVIIGTISDNTLHILHKERIYVHLGEGGLGHLRDSAIQRGIDALLQFKQIVKEHEVSKVVCIGTAALRSAQNSESFTEAAFLNTGWNINIIDGRQEAAYIHHGVQLIHPKQENTTLIMDIGGGSVEFIISDVHGIHWKNSYNVGILELFNRFHGNDPYTESTLQDLLEYLKNTFQEVAAQCRTHSVAHLVGASGTFDVLARLATADADNWTDVSFDIVNRLFSQSKFLDANERLELKEVPRARAQYIVEALALIQAVREIHSFKSLSVSRYALKEGALSDVLNI